MLKRRKHYRNKALMRSLVSSLARADSLTTTFARAKALQCVIEPLVTFGKNLDRTQASRQLARKITDKETIRLLCDLGAKYYQRPGGYTRVIKQQVRLSDGATTATISWV